MAKELCEICHQRPATMEVTISRDGRKEILNVCEYDYNKLLKEQQFRSPIERMFSRNPFDDFFAGFDDFDDFSSRLGYPLPRHREAVDIDQYFPTTQKNLFKKPDKLQLNLKETKLIPNICFMPLLTMK